MSTDGAARTIILLRHAKSSWGLDVPDHERPLSGRGRRDGSAVGSYLVEHRLRPDLVLCSTALRARQTWDRAVEAGAGAGAVSFHDQIYEGFAPELRKLIRKQAPSDVRTLLMIGHSPGIAELAGKLGIRKGNKAAWNRIDSKFPTGGLVILSYPGDWAELSSSCAQLVAFDVPRAAQPF